MYQVDDEVYRVIVMKGVVSSVDSDIVTASFLGGMRLHCFMEEHILFDAGCGKYIVAKPSLEPSIVISDIIYHANGFELNVTAKEPERLPGKGTPVLVSDDPDGPWGAHAFIHKNSARLSPYIVSNPYCDTAGKAYPYCIPLVGNEHLIDAKGEPKVRF